MAAHPEQQAVLTFEEARRVVEEHASGLRPRGRELLSLLDASGRILAEPIHADRDYPPFPRATRDGYALRAADVASVPAELKMIGEIRAGASADLSVDAGQAVSIMTGAAVPLGADAVVMVEHTSRTGDRVQVTRQVSEDENIVLAAQIHSAGAEPVVLPIAPDEPLRLRELLAEGLEADLLLIAGGVSMGKYDLVEQALAEMQAEFFFTGALIQPGRPVVFGRVPCGADIPVRETAGNYKYFFGLPGNPISTMVTFELFARPAIEALTGMSPRNLAFTRAKLKTDIQARAGLKRFLPAILSGEFEQTEVELVRWQGSGDIAAVTRANCYVVVPPDRERIPAGEWVPLLLR